MKKVYTLDAKVWLYQGNAAWHFLTIPPEITVDIDFYFGMAKKGWGSLPVLVSIGNTSWTTSIFPDKKTNTYLLPLKAAIRGKETILLNQVVTVAVEIVA